MKLGNLNYKFILYWLRKEITIYRKWFAVRNQFGARKKKQFAIF